MNILKHATTTLLLITILLASAWAHAQTSSGSGVVAETLSVTSYTYIRLEEPGGWIAAPPVAVSAGDKVEFSGGMPMGKFYSKTLDRTFDPMTFVGNVKVIERDIESMHGAAVDDATGPQLELPKSAKVEAPLPGSIKRFEGGSTIAEIFTGSSALDGHAVTLRAKVVKVNEDIMGKNWATLQDGTGIEPDNKLLATSEEIVVPGDIVVATGILKKDADIGSGYKYKVLLEEVNFTASKD